MRMWEKRHFPTKTGKVGEVQDETWVLEGALGSN